MDQLKLIKAVIGIAITAIVLLCVYSWVKGVPVFSIFQSRDKMERTATILRSIENTNRWVFLTIEDEEVEVIENVCKIYPAFYELGIEIKDTTTWYNIKKEKGEKVAHLTLPAIYILDSGGINDMNVINVYGEATPAVIKKMKKDAEIDMKKRALSESNMQQAKDNAFKHFKNLFMSLGCKDVKIDWKN